MKKIVFGITSLTMGGAERVLVDLVNRLKDDYDITVFTIYGNGELEKNLDPKIELINLISKRYDELSFLKKKEMSLMFSSPLWLNFIYRKHLKKKFDIEVSFLEGPITSLFACGKNLHKIAWIHTNLESHIHNNFRKKQYQKDYMKYKKIIFISNDTLNGFNNLYNINVEKQIIPNYIDIKDIKNKSLEYIPEEMDSSIPSFSCVCRLVKAKALDRLLLVSKKLLEGGYKHKVYVVGEGPERESLTELIKSLDMQDDFILIGQKSNPFPYMKKASYFILPSLYEGFGMVLIEAMVLEKYIIATDTGAKEALKDYERKLIVENSFKGLYDGMKKVLIKKEKFGIIHKLAYDPEKIITQIKEVLEENI